MKTKLTLVLIFCVAFVFAQDSIKKNIIKTNLPALAYKNLNLQYERVLTKRSSILLGVGYIPSGSVPFKSNLENYVSEEDHHYFNQAQLGYFSLTPEYRVYLGKGYGKGFYFSPYYRYSKFTFEKVNIAFENDLGADENLDLEGDISAHSFGVMLGVSFNLSKNLVLDWWIVGGHYGNSSGNAIGRTNFTLSSTEQQRVQEELENIDLPLIDEKITVNSNGGTMKFDGEWAGLRSGISLGFRF